MDEHKVLRALRRGSEEALGQIMDHYAPYVYTIVSNFLSRAMSQADIEEVMADTFFALWNGAEKVRPGKLKSYLGAVARNQARQKLRSRGQELPLEEDVLTLPDPSPEEQLAEREQEELVRRAVLNMGEPDREIFLRHYYYGQPVAEIARVMAMNPATVKTRLHRGRVRLHKQWTEGD